MQQNLLEALIHEEIAKTGPITVERYMQLCLQHPQYGYYRRQLAIGSGADFITAPEISQLFGDLLGMWVADKAATYPQGFALAELGPGRGTLAADVMRMLAKCGQTPPLHLVESNAALRAEQANRLAPFAPKWHEDVDSLPAKLPLIVLANEFFDALPIRQFVGAEERGVGLDAEGVLYFTPKGAVTREDSPASAALMRALAQRLRAQGGALLVVDYGYEEGEELEEGKNRDTLQALRQHAYSNPLEHAGEQDLTAHVDFSALAETARQAGCNPAPLTTQAAFLQGLGGDIWLQKLMQAASCAEARRDLELGWLRLIAPAQMGQLFKVLEVMG